MENEKELNSEVNSELGDVKESVEATAENLSEAITETEVETGTDSIVEVEGEIPMETENADADNEETETEEKETDAPVKEKKKMPKALMIILIILGSLIVLAGVAVVVMVNHFYNLTNYESTTESVMESVEETTRASEVEEAIETMATLDEEKELEIMESVSEAQEVLETEESYDDENYHILLIGVDRRDESWCGNSDAMMLMTINYKEEKVILTSFMRDMGVQIPGLGFRKLNNAYAVGEGPLLLQTYKENFGLDIDNYAWIDFDDAVAIIDAMGGVDIELTVQEATYLKKYLGYTIEQDQVCHLNGIQAMKYARDRTSAGSDYQRTQRQRNVIMAVINKAKNGEIENFVGTIVDVLPYITHNIEKRTLWELLARVPTILQYDFSQQRVPFDDMYHTEGEFLIPDYEQTIQKLRDTLCD